MSAPKQKRPTCILCAAGLIAFTAGALAQEPELYSTTQAKLGATVYAGKCEKCHMPDGMAPVLKGDSFWSEWDGKPARALYSRILSTMPADDPGSIPEKDVINLVAYIMQMNDLHGGTADIQTPDELNKIVMKRGK